MEDDNELEYRYEYNLKCILCAVVHDMADVNQLSPIIQAVINSLSARKKSEVKAWQEDTLKPCQHTSSLEQTKGVQLQSQSHCHACSLDNNLWLCKCN
jgi:ubiquitin carboxyl-terminal hydrolase 5/13